MTRTIVALATLPWLAPSAVFGKAPSSAILIDCSTIDVDTARRCAELYLMQWQDAYAAPSTVNPSP